MTTVTLSNNSDGNSFLNLDNVPIVIADTASTSHGADFEYGDLLSFIKSKFDDFDLKTLLTTSALGKSILSYYAANEKLDNTRRNRLVSIIIKHLYNYIVKK